MFARSSTGPTNSRPVGPTPSTCWCPTLGQRDYLASSIWLASTPRATDHRRAAVRAIHRRQVQPPARLVPNGIGAVSNPDRSVTVMAVQPVRYTGIPDRLAVGKHIDLGKRPL